MTDFHIMQNANGKWCITAPSVKGRGHATINVWRADAVSPVVRQAAFTERESAEKTLRAIEAGKVKWRAA